MARCTYCGKSTENSGSGKNMGTQNKPMCERCYEHGGDDDQFKIKQYGIKRKICTENAR